MTVGSIVTAFRYNQLQAIVDTTLGLGSGDAGYGQQLSSSQILPTAIVTAAHINNIRTDLLSIYVHQNGNNNITLLQRAVTELISDAEYTSFSALANSLFSLRNTASSLNFSLSRVLTSTRTLPWGGGSETQKVSHEARIIFPSANARRHYFNTGSEIRFDASLTNFSGTSGALPKFTNWAGMLSSIETVLFKSTETTVTGSGTASSIGNFNLTDTYQLIFIKSGSGLYSENTYTIKAREVDSSTISFLIEFNDVHTGSGIGIYGVDESILGLLTSRVFEYRATGTSISGINKVIAPTPTYQNTSNL